VALAYVLHQLSPVIGNATALANLTRLPVLGTVSVGRLEEHRAEMRSSAFRFATAFAGLLVVFGMALIFRNDLTTLLQRI
jgi:hypothetical protein